MDYTTLGSTGLKVSQICLGCLGFGSSQWRDWVLDEDESVELIQYALDQGINYFDTANMYSAGESERVLGKAIDGHREETVINTKVYHQIDEGNPNSGGLSRKSIEQELDQSLARLGMETLDIYTIHRWDYNTPFATTIRCLDDLVRRGRVRYIGSSSMWAHQFARALHTSDRTSLERFVAMQNHYNLVYREEEREMIPLCRSEDIAITPWSVFARGYLTKPPENELNETTRGKSEELLYEYPYTEGGGPEIRRRVYELATERGVSMAQICLAWIFQKDGIGPPIVGATKRSHIDDAVEAVNINLSDNDVEYLEEPYEPVRIAGHD